MYNVAFKCCIKYMTTVHVYCSRGDLFMFRLKCVISVISPHTHTQIIVIFYHPLCKPYCIPISQWIRDTKSWSVYPL